MDRKNMSFCRPLSIYRVTNYVYRYYTRKRTHYPCFRLRTAESSFHLTLKEAEEWVSDNGRIHRFVKENVSDDNIFGTYAYVITEIPLGVETKLDILGENLSERIYSPDGTLWAKRDFCNFIPNHCHSPEEYNYWGRLGIFKGRNPEEIKFKPGDIVEVFGYSGNDYWSNEEVNLAIVVKCPPTVSEMSQKLQEYRATHSGFDLCDHAISSEFGHREDTYEVLSLACENIDHAPTIATFRPSLPVSTRMRNRLQKMYEQYMENKAQKPGMKWI